MTSLPKYVAKQGYRFEVIQRPSGKVFLRQSPAPRYGRAFSQEVTPDDVRALVTWDAHKAGRDAERKQQTATCQVCGRAICHAQGLIAHHGYERPLHGYQTDSCDGARELPFEQSRDALGAHIEKLKQYLESRRVRLATIEADDYSESLIVSDGRRGSKLVRHDDNQWQAARRQAIAETKRDIEAIPESIAMQTARFDTWKKSI